MEVESSTDSLSEYELQVVAALKTTPKGDEYDSLISLKADLEELINLTTGAENPKQPGGSDLQQNLTETCNDNDLDDEYALFMKEVSNTEASDNVCTNKNKDDNNIKSQEFDDDIASLEGTQCALYFSHHHGGAPSLYNAMICSVIKDISSKTKNNDDIMVKIMFTNPTHIEMVPCPYYLDGECKFDEFECRFSHGETVPLTSLKEATKPVFSNLKVGSRVLAKIKKNEDAPMSTKQSEKYLLWHRAIIRYLDADNCTCEVQLENNIFSTQGIVNYTVEFENLFPLIGSESDADSLSESDNESDVEHSLNEDIVEKSLTNNLNSVKLGDWEKHTKGIGSKLMLKMGYVIGTGLGPQGEGRIQPVTCQITPSGRSLDHCMKLREESSSEDPLKVEKRLRRLEKKKEEREKKAYEKLMNKEKHDVFNFLNKTLSGNVHGNFKNTSDGDKNSKTKENNLNVKTSSCKNLNIEKFKLEEDIRRIEKDIVKLKDSMARNIKNLSVHNGLSVKLSSKMEEIDQLKRKQTNISNEQNNRKDKRKLTVF